jgi:hypothetical protein
MKTKADYPYIYFFIEPNMVYVYKIESKQYLTVSDLSYSGEWLTYEMDADKFDTFDHRQEKPLAGRGYFVPMFFKNLMLEKINQQIRKHRSHIPGIVHIVASDSAAGSLRFGLERPNTVIGFSGGFAFGPIWHLEQKGGQSLRNEWIFDNINLGMDDFEYENHFANLLLEIADIPEQSPIYLWAGYNGEEQTGIRFILYLLKDMRNDIILINTSPNTGEMHPDELRKLFEMHRNAAPMSVKEREQYYMEWEALADSKELLRVWLNGRIEEVSEDYYDQLIISAIKEINHEDFIKAARVIGTAMSQTEQLVSDAFLEYRLRHLIYNGTLALKGIPKSMRHYSVKLK